MREMFLLGCLDLIFKEWEMCSARMVLWELQILYNTLSTNSTSNRFLLIIFLLYFSENEGSGVIEELNPFYFGLN